MSEAFAPFADPQAVARYAEATARLVPGFASLQRMAAVLLAERAPANARVLVLGAGGGLELKAFADAQPGWTFDGVDPSVEMLALAEQTLGPLRERVHLHEGYIDIAPDGPFDAAACLLTLHFTDPEERLRTLAELHRRLRPGAPFVAAHHSFPQNERALWLSRCEAFAVASGVDPEKAARGREAVDARLPILSPEADVEIMRQAGFSGITQIYAALTFRGWVATA
ncbi:MAG: class I SAM-dependent methyltransferase [Hyphomonadaceae bacterium]